MTTAEATIERQVLKWSAAKKVALAERLLASVEDFASPEIEQAWDAEIERRVKDVEEGKEAGLPADDVMAQARRKLSETRRLSQARRKRVR